MHLDPDRDERVAAVRRVREPHRGVAGREHSVAAFGVELELRGERGVGVLPPVGHER